MPRFTIATWPVHDKTKLETQVIEAEDASDAWGKAWDLAGFAHAFEVQGLAPASDEEKESTMSKEHVNQPQPGDETRLDAPETVKDKPPVDEKATEAATALTPVVENPKPRSKSKPEAKAEADRGQRERHDRRNDGDGETKDLRRENVNTTKERRNDR